MRFLKKLIAGLIIFFLFSPKIVKADLLAPPVELFTTPLTLGLFIGNLIVNFFIFGIAYLIFVESNIGKINKKSFLVTIVLITVAGFFSDSFAFALWNKDNFLTLTLILSFLIVLSNFLICKYYLKLSSIKSIILGLWMGLFTNPLVFIIISAFITLPLSIFFHPPRALHALP
jgi:hypothetical protein